MGKPRTTKKPTKSTRDPAPATEVIAAPPPERTYSLEENLARTGPSNLDEVNAFIEGQTDRELTELGATVDTSRIDTDSARCVGQALDFYDRATPAQLGKLRGVSSTMLRAMAWAAVQGHDAYVALHMGQTEARTVRYSRRETSSSLTSQGRAQLLQLGEALRVVAAGDAATLDRIQLSVTVSNHAEGLPAAMEATVKLGRSLLAKPSKSMLVRLADGQAGISTEWLDACQDLAHQIRQAGIAALSALPTPPVSQADVDRWDGINLVLLRQLIRLFEAGHRVEPSIQRLIPISLRTVFGYRKAKPAETAQPAAPAQPGN